MMAYFNKNYTQYIINLIRRKKLDELEHIKSNSTKKQCINKYNEIKTYQKHDYSKMVSKMQSISDFDGNNEERKKNGWSQEELAEQLAVSRQSVSKWEGAQSVPDLNRIIQTVKFLTSLHNFLL